MRTDTEIQAEIFVLISMKPQVRKKSFFGDDHHRSIEAQIQVLTERMTMDTVHARFGEEAWLDESEFDQNELDNAIAAHDWMFENLAKDEDQAPSEGWKELVI